MEGPNVQMDTSYGPSFLEGRKSRKMQEVEPGIIGGISDFLLIDDLLDFSNEEIAAPIGEKCSDASGVDSSTVTNTAKMAETMLSCNNDSLLDNRISTHISNAVSTDIKAHNSPADLCVSCDDLAELEWLSNFVEDSFSTGNVPTEITHHVLDSGKGSSSCILEILPLPSRASRARSKRSRAPVCNWVSRILNSPSSSASIVYQNGYTSSESYEQAGGAESLSTNTNKLSKTKTTHVTSKKRGAVQVDHHGIQVRKCSHCATQKTPQWRAGPEGPKTLCNACGVRFKSGRLLPEYRPAASPTFEGTQHSNSHRKVVELRRQKLNEIDEKPKPHDHIEKLVQGLIQYNYSSSEQYSDFGKSDDDECLLHNNINTGEDMNFCRQIV